jgi:hypothetical protein
MSDLSTGQLFAVEGQTFGWRDVVLFAHVAGRWSAVVREVSEGLACADYADTLEDPALEESVDAAAAEFRYDRDLITAEETEDWLSARGVTPADWLASIRRSELRQRFADRLEALRAAHPPKRAAVEQALLVDLLCTDLGQDLAEFSAERIAAAVAVGVPLQAPSARGDPGRLPPGVDPEHARTLRPLFEQVGEGVRRFQESSLSAEALQRAVEGHRMDWVRLECRSVAFSDATQAREAAMCLREDGQNLDQVAAEARLEPRDAGFFVDEVEQTLQPVFLSARPGDILGPIELDGAQTLYQVISKTMPTESDPAVRSRAAEWLLTRALAEEARRRVTWLVRW